MRFPRLLALAVLASPAVAQPPPTQKHVPPAGVKIPEQYRAELEKGVQELGSAIQTLRSNTAAAQLLPDVAVFHKAVDWALRYDEFMNPKQVGTAKTLLA